MNKYKHLREKALEMREKGAALGEISDKLCLGRTTVYYWIKDIKIPETQCQKTARYNLGKYKSDICSASRNENYMETKQQAKKLLESKVCRDFIIAYMCEGCRRNRNTVCLANITPTLLIITKKFLETFSNRTINYTVMANIDNNQLKIKSYWSKILHVPKSSIIVYIKKTILGDRGRRLPYGTMRIFVHDTALRARLEAMIDEISLSYYSGHLRDKDKIIGIHQKQ
jgi:hypothetical protein